jgi:N-acetylglucosamine-6-phosphate deacetylase
MIALIAPRLFDGTALSRGRVVVIDAGRIIEAGDRVPAGVTPESLPPDAILAPGFIDLQVNGGGGLLLNNTVSIDAMRAIAAAHARVGTTSILPTLISGSRAQIAAALAAAANAIALNVPGVAGLHVEGPFISPARHGIHPIEAITPMTDADVALLASPRPFPLMVTLAPDAVPGEQIAVLARSGVVVFAGHTDATYEQVRGGLRAGISGFTHLFNAMSQLGSRAPGAVGAALAHADAYAGIIVDGRHAHPAAITAAFTAKGAARLLFVSDAMATAASDLDHFLLNGKTIRLRNGRLTDEAGTLAGAHLTMAEAVRNAVELAGIPLADALRMATATPAACMRLTDRGRIAASCRADLVALDADLRVVAVWQEGVRL